MAKANNDGSVSLVITLNDKELKTALDAVEKNVDKATSSAENKATQSLSKIKRAFKRQIKEMSKNSPELFGDTAKGFKKMLNGDALAKQAYKQAKEIGKIWRKQFGAEIPMSEIKKAGQNYLKSFVEQGHTPEEGKASTTAFMTGLKRGSAEMTGFEKATSLFKKGISGAITGVKGLGKGLLNLAGKGLKKGISALGSMGRKAIEAGKNLLGFNRASRGINLKNILGYALAIKGLFALFQKLKQFATEGFGNLSKAGGETQQNVQNLSASMLYLKNALGSAIAPIYNVVAPALSKFVDMLAGAVNAFGKFVGALTGKGFTTVAKKSFAGITDGASGAGSAMGNASEQAEELKRQLMGFDQIEKLDSVTENLGGSGGSSGGGGGGTDYGDMFTVEEVNEQAKDWAKLVKDAWANADFTDLGEIVGTKIANALKGIPWGEIQEQASRIGKSLATFLNGIAKSDFFPTLGTAIGEAFNTAIYSAYAFVTNFNFPDFGESIGTSFNNIMTTIDWETAGATFSAGVSGLFDLASGAIQAVHWKDLGESVGEFLRGIKWSEIISSAFTLVGSLAGAVAGFAAGLFNDLKTAIGEWFTDNCLNDDGELTIGSFLTGLWNGIKNIGSWLYTNIWVPFRDGFKNAFGIDSPSWKFKEYGIDVIQGLLNGLKEKWKDVKTWLDERKKDIKEKWEDVKTWLVGYFNQEYGSGTNTSGSSLSQSAQAVKLSFDIALTQQGDEVLKRVKEARDKRVQVEANGSMTSGFIAMDETVKGVKDKTATVTAKGKTDKTFTDNRNVYEKVKSETVFKTYDSKYSNWNKWAERRNEYGKVKSDTATKSLGNIFPNWSKWSDRRNEYNAIKNGTVTKSLGNIFPDWRKWADRRNEYNAIKDSTAKKSLESSWANGTKWNNDIAEYDAVKDKTATVYLDAKKSYAYKQAADNYSVFSGNTMYTQEIPYGNFAKGGAFYAGSWRSIPQFANGGGIPNHGTLFVAGEAGAEAVANIGGRTEVLNRSQFGSAIASGVARTLSRIHIPNPTPQLAFVERQMAQQNAQQGQALDTVVSVLTQILSAIINKDSDVYFDTNKVTNEIVKQINRNTRATGVCEIMI